MELQSCVQNEQGISNVQYDVRPGQSDSRCSPIPIITSQSGRRSHFGTHMGHSSLFAASKGKPA